MKILSVKNPKDEKSRVVAKDNDEAIAIAKEIIDVTDAEVTDVTEVLFKAYEQYAESLKCLLKQDRRGCLAYTRAKGFVLIECDKVEGRWAFSTNRQPLSIALDG